MSDTLRERVAFIVRVSRDAEATATDIIALIRNETLEEAARVADDHAPVCQDMEGTIIAERCDAIATAIRALKEKTNG